MLSMVVFLFRRPALGVSHAVDSFLLHSLYSDPIVIQINPWSNSIDLMNFSLKLVLAKSRRLTTLETELRIEWVQRSQQLYKQ